MYNPGTSDHLYTTTPSLPEYNAYCLEGITGYVYNVAAAGRVPLYEMYNAQATDHFYTTSAK
jgi:hypothetical protein